MEILDSSLKSLCSFPLNFFPLLSLGSQARNASNESKVDPEQIATDNSLIDYTHTPQFPWRVDFFVTSFRLANGE